MGRLIRQIPPHSSKRGGLNGRMSLSLTSAAGLPFIFGGAPFVGAFSPDRVA